LDGYAKNDKLRSHLLFAEESRMISGVVLARNEQRNIVACLERLRPHVDEVILIDMHSEDRTVELARPLVDQILTHEVIPNFDAARNMAIPAAKHEWLWFVDADEHIPAETGHIINQLVRQRGHELTAITIPFKSYFCGQWMQHCGWWPGYTMPRVLKRGHFSFSAQLHGGVHHNGPSVRLPPDPDTAVDHYSYESVEHYLDKLNRYTSTEAMQLAAGGATYDWRQAIRHMIHDLWLYYERNPGYLDGVRGWLLAWLSGQYRWLSYAKLVDSSGADSCSQPACIEEVLDEMTGALAGCRAAAPALPLGIVWRGPIWDPSGYADESRSFVKGLAAGERPLAVEDLHWADAECELPVGDKILLKALLNAKRPAYTATITNCICTLASPVADTSLNILRTTFETDRLPEGWLDYLLAYDEIWVISQHNYRAFVRSWVPPEKLRVVPSCFDEAVYRPDGELISLPGPMEGRFVFLSVFDWDLRKGWDLLLRGFVETFRPEEGVGLLLKITRNHGHTTDEVRSQIEDVLQGVGATLESRTDVFLWDEVLTGSEVAALYRSVDAFVLPTRGEGWGRPYMEAMASGLPCIGTNGSGNVDFMTEENSYLVATREEPVPEQSAHGLQTYAGHQWFEPDLADLRRQLRYVFEHQDEARHRGALTSEEVRRKFGLEAGRQAMEEALAAVETKFIRCEAPPVRPDQIRIELEGELYAGHSFAKVNEALLDRFIDDDQIAISFRRTYLNPTTDPFDAAAARRSPFIDRSLTDGPQVTIRHAFPPNWEPPAQGKWVHVQPFEYGHLPLDWVPPLRDLVDEIWAPTEYVRRLYERSGVPSEKIHVIPWGIDPEVYRPDAIPLLLPTSRTFRFLFVGGTIARKGFDRVLEAYRQEFTKNDDVALVVKGLGEETFYRYGNFRKELLDAIADPDAPEIVSVDHFLTEGQLPSLYAACHCLVAPYRGEGFGLPILEAMACGLPPIIPRGGPSDDFATEDCAFLLSSEITETTHSWKLSGPATEFSISIADLRQAMRNAFENQQRTRAMGVVGSLRAREEYSWERVVASMTERIRVLIADIKPKTNRDCTLAALLCPNGSARELAVQLAQVRPFVDELSVAANADDARITAISSEYRARLRSAGGPSSALWREMAANAKSPWIWIPDFGSPWSGNPYVFSQLRRQLAALDDSVDAVAVNVNREPRSERIPGYFVRNRVEVVGLIEPSPDRSLSVAALEPSIYHLTICGAVADGPVPPTDGQPARHLPVEQWLEAWAPKGGRVFLDIGANVGAWTRWLAGSFNQVHAFEPHPEAVAQLRDGLPANVTVHPFGAWSLSKTVEFSQFENSVHLSAYFRDEGIHTGPRIGRTEIECVAIDDLHIDGPIDFIKCDTEGAELEVMKGAERTILSNRPWLLIEIHSLDNFTAVTTLLGAWNYLFTVIRDPYYEHFSELWYAHCWLSCQPRLSYH
jgi:FkbM family methyltransferase